jgi:Bacterial regulatory helix-turn-helix protein, lysR family
MLDDIRRLRLLCDVALTGTIAAAAERAGCAAAAASQQFTALERQTGAALLERSARSVRLADAGRVLVEHAHWVLAELAGAVRGVAGLRGGRLKLVDYAATVLGLTVQIVAKLAGQVGFVVLPAVVYGAHLLLDQPLPPYGTRLRAPARSPRRHGLLVNVRRHGTQAGPSPGPPDKSFRNPPAPLNRVYQALQ